MKKLIIKFVENGVCKIDVNQVVKMWNDKWRIYKWNEEYTLCFPFRKGSRRITISEAQAKELISKIELISVKSTLLVSGTSFFTKNYILSELDRIKEIANEKYLDLEVINREIINLNNSLLSV